MNCGSDNNVPNNNESTSFEPKNLEIEILLNSVFDATSYYPVEVHYYCYVYSKRIK